jgi:hypothetical protein
VSAIHRLQFTGWVGVCNSPSAIHRRLCNSPPPSAIHRKLQHSATLTATPIWQDLGMTDTFLLAGGKWKLLNTKELANPRVGFYRLLKP